VFVRVTVADVVEAGRETLCSSQDYCMNHGTCYILRSLGRKFCRYWQYCLLVESSAGIGSIVYWWKVLQVSAVLFTGGKFCRYRQYCLLVESSAGIGSIVESSAGIGSIVYWWKVLQVLAVLFTGGNVG